MLVRFSDSTHNRAKARAALRPLEKGKIMIWTIVVLLAILWLLGFSFHVGGGLIHLLLVVALVVLVFNVLGGRRRG